MAGIFHLKSVRKFGLDDKSYSYESFALAYLVLISAFSLSIGLIAFESLSNVYYFIFDKEIVYPISFNYAFWQGMALVIFYVTFLYFFLHRYLHDRGNIYLIFLNAGCFWGILAGVILELGSHVLLVTIFYTSHGLTFEFYFKHYWILEKPKFIWAGSVFIFCAFHLIFKRSILKKDDEVKETEKSSGKLGSGQFANKAYLKQVGLISSYKKAKQGFGFAIGKLAPKTYVTLNESTHSITIAPPREGKAVSKAIPLILDSNHALFVLDVKGELFLSTYEEIKRKGRSPIVFAPTGLLNKFGDFRWYTQIHFNPLNTHFDLSGLNREKYLDNLVKSLTIDIEQETKERHFIDLTKPLLKAMLDEYLNTGKTLVNLYDHFMSISNEEMISRLRQLLLKQPNSRLLKNAISTLESTDPRELSGIKNTLNRCLNFLTNNLWSYCFGQDGLDFYQYVVNNRDLFICIDQATIENNPKVIRMIFSQLKSTYEILTPKQIQNKEFPLVLDEVAQLGAIDEIEKIYEIFGDKHVRLNLFFQSIDQINKFKKSELLKSIELKQIFGVRDPQTIEWIQKLAGKQTVSLTSYSKSDSLSKSTQKAQFFANNINHGVSSSESRQESSTELLHTNIIRELDSGKQIVFFRNLRPIICDRIVYYEDKRYKTRFSPNFCFKDNQHLIDYDQADAAEKAFQSNYQKYLDDQKAQLAKKTNQTKKSVNNHTNAKIGDFATENMDKLKTPKPPKEKMITLESKENAETEFIHSPIDFIADKPIENDEMYPPAADAFEVENAYFEREQIPYHVIEETNVNEQSLKTFDAENSDLTQNEIKEEKPLSAKKEKSDTPKQKPMSQYKQYSVEEAIEIYLQVKENRLSRKEALDKYSISRHHYDRARKKYEESLKKS